MSVEDVLANLPTVPGVYLMKDAQGDVIYVGKAINLRNRVRQYFQSSRGHSPKVVRMVQDIVDIDYIVTGSELEALILECNLIKQYRPHYNVRLRDDKTYPYIRVTVNERYPRAFMTRRVVRDGSRYFGPYTDVPAVRETLRLMKRIFPLRQCSMKMDADMPLRRPCLNYHIKQCLGPCSGAVPPETYREVVNQVILFLEGRQDRLMDGMKRRMEASAESLDFEQAAIIRDQLKAVETVVEKQRIVSEAGVDRDVIAFARDPWGACVQVLFIRGGKIVGSDHFMLGGEEGADDSDDSETISSFMKEYYARAATVPREIVVQSAPEDSDVVEKWLAGIRGRSVSLVNPKRGEKKELVDLAAANAREYLDRVRAAEQGEERARHGALLELAAYLGLAEPPHRIECYDISNLQGTEAVGSMVVFEDGLPAKSQYRRFRIRGVEGQNDFAMIAEVLGRRLSHSGTVDSKFARLPDLIVVDGGKGQLSAAGEVIDAKGFGSIPAIGLAERNEEVFLRGESDPLVIPRDSRALHILQHIRDEAHRFAVSYHRSLRGKKGISSELTNLPGIGKTRLIALMRKFGSLAVLQEASLHDIAATPGMNAPSARAVYQHLHGGPPEAVEGDVATDSATDSATGSAGDVGADEQMMHAADRDMSTKYGGGDADEKP